MSVKIVIFHPREREREDREEEEEEETDIIMYRGQKKKNSCHAACGTTFRLHFLLYDCLLRGSKTIVSIDS